MAKFTSKRKPEASKTTRSGYNQSLVISRAPEDNTIEGEGDENEKMFVKQPPVQQVRLMKRVKAAKSKPIRFEEDQYLKENQEFLDMVKFGSKKQPAEKRVNKYLEDFTHMAKGQLGVIKDLKALTNKSLNGETGFSEEFHEAHHAVITDGSVVERYSDGSHSLKSLSTSITGDAYQLLAEIESLGLELASHKQSTMLLKQKWQQDIYDMEGTLGIGKGAGEARIASVLTGSPATDIRPDYVRASVSLFGNETVVMDGMTWANVARRQERSIKRLIGTFTRG